MLIVFVVTLSFSSVFAVGINTLNNQSAQYGRTLSRNASTDVDAAYYNPAGMTLLQDGWHFNFSSQTIFQTWNMDTDHPNLNENSFQADIKVPVMPSGFAVYKKGKSAFSLSFGVYGGGGSAVYSNGAPMFEMVASEVADKIPFSKGYQMDANLDGTSIFMGTQLNYAYQINDWISVGGGMRFIFANNSYDGLMDNIGVLMPTGVMQLPGMEQLGIDAEQSGFGVTPILSVNLKPIKGLNFAARYEFKTNIDLTNDTRRDDTAGIISEDGMYPDGKKVSADMPAILALGADYMATDKLKLTASYTAYFEKGVDWGHDPLTGAERTIDHNTNEYSLGLEYAFSDKFTWGAGYMFTDAGVSKEFQNDLSFSVSGQTIGTGVSVLLWPRLNMDLSMMWTNYSDDTRNYGTFTETFGKTNIAFAVGLSYSIFK